VTSHTRRTKIVATIGPASSDDAVVAALIEAGMDGARMNLSHGTHEDHARTAELVRTAEAAAGRSISLIADLQGPKLRIGDLPGPVALSDGDSVVIAGEEVASGDDIPVSPSVLGSVLRPGHEVLIDDGHIRLRVDRVDGGRAACTVVVGGVVASHKGVNLPGVPCRSRRSPGRTSTTSSSPSAWASTTSRSRSSAPRPTSRRCAR
jgi:pyruvate kinase